MATSKENLKTQKEINQELEKQQQLLSKIDETNANFKNTQKEILRLQEELFRARQKEGDLTEGQQPLYKQIQESIKQRLNLINDINQKSDYQTDQVRAANILQKEAMELEGALLESIQGQVSWKDELNDVSTEQLKVVGDLNKGQLDLASLNEQIAASEARLGSDRLKNAGLVKDDEEALLNILKGKKSAMVIDKASSMAKEAGLKTADKLSGGMVSKAKDFGAKMGISPKHLAKLGVAGLIVGVMIKAVTGFSKKIDQVGETFGFMTNKNKEFRNDLIDSGNEAMMIGKNLGDVLAVTSQLSSEFGITLKESEDIAGTVLDTAVATGISNDEATKLFGTFMKIGGLTSDQAENLIESTAQLAAQSGVAPKAVLQDMAGSAEEIASFTKDGGENIAEAAVQARQMGLSLSTTAKISEGLLDFESSIANEVEASVMIGKQLNYQRARQLALAGDIAGATKEIVNQVGSEAEFNALNVMQRKSLAKSIGVSVSEMSKLVAASDKLTLSGALAGKKFDDLVGQDALSGLTSIINSVKMVGASVMDELGKPVAEMLKTFQESLMTPEGMKTFKNDIIGVINGFTGFINGLMSFAEIFVWGDLARIAKIPQVNDFKSGPGQITHMMGPAGSFELNPRDSVLATTNSIPVNDVATGAAGSMGFGNVKQLVEAQKETTRAIANLELTAGRGEIRVAMEPQLGGALA